MDRESRSRSPRGEDRGRIVEEIRQAISNLVEDAKENSINHHAMASSRRLANIINREVAQFGQSAPTDTILRMLLETTRMAHIEDTTRQIRRLRGNPRDI